MLETELNTIDPPTEIKTIESFNERLQTLTDIIHKVEEEHVPLNKNTPYWNHWWNEKLRMERTQVQKLAKSSWKRQDQSQDPIYHEYRKAWNRYGDNIKKEKVEFWLD